MRRQPTGLTATLLLSEPLSAFSFCVVRLSVCLSVSLLLSKRKIMDFLSILEGFKSAVKVIEVFADSDISSSRLLKKIVTLTDNGGM